MDVYLMNGYGSVYPTMNGTSSVRPMNEPITAAVTLGIAAVKLGSSIVKAHKEGKKTRQQAHTEFMNLVYANVPGLSQAEKSQLHQFATVNLSGALQWLEAYVAKMVADQERQIAAEAALIVGMRNPASANPQQVIAVTKDLVDKSVSDSQNGTFPTPGQVADQVLKSGVAGWWSARTTTQKAMIVGGGLLAVGGLIYVLTREKKRSAPRRSAARKTTKTKKRK